MDGGGRGSGYRGPGTEVWGDGDIGLDERETVWFGLSGVGRWFRGWVHGGRTLQIRHAETGEEPVVSLSEGGCGRGGTSGPGRTEGDRAGSRGGRGPDDWVGLFWWVSVVKGRPA